MAKGRKNDRGAAPSNSKAAVTSYVKRMTNVYNEIIGLTADLKEIGDAAKGEGFDPAMLKRWARAIAADKQSELAAKAMMLTAIGEIVEPTLFDKLPEPDVPASAQAGATH